MQNDENTHSNPRFFTQNIAANDPLKKIPSIAAKATRRSAKVDFLSLIHLNAQSAFRLMSGTAILI